MVIKRSLFSHIILLSMALGILITTSCKKDADNDIKTVTGTIDLEVHVKHHSWDVSGIMVYLKKNTSEFPGRDSTLYEFSLQADGYGKVTFENLYPGDYYIYASGFDSIWGSNVYGYNGIALNSSSINNFQAKLTLIVSE